MALTYHHFDQSSGKLQSGQIEPSVLHDGSPHPYEGHISRNSRIGLGYEAVLRSLDEAFQDDGRLGASERLYGMGMPLESEYQYPAHAISKVRLRLGRLNEAAAQSIAAKIADESPFLRASLLGEQPHSDDHTIPGWTNQDGEVINESQRGEALRRRLFEQTNDELGVPDFSVSDDTVRNFAEWLAHSTQREQAQLDKEIREHKNHYRALTTLRVRERQLPEEAIDRLRFLDRVDVLADDQFATTQGGRLSAPAWYHRMGSTYDGRDRPMIALAPGHSEHQKVHLLNHEFTHAISPSKETLLDRHSMLVPLLGHFGATVIDEALTEHWNARLQDGYFDKTYPDYGHADTYGTYRMLFDTLCNRGEILIDPREWYSALYFAEYDEDGILADDRVIELERKLAQAFPGVDVFAKLRSLEEGKDQYESDQIVGEFIDELLAPKPDKRGGKKTPKIYDRMGRRLAQANLLLLQLTGDIK